ncbi:myoneurin-like isoform X2 [Physella acuta]|uniref:myoneurin-like isoform X2 n=1 Tax=Physella acuta TaxID=109671 RepID=UPI0027DB860F|nr:myoneurin-like isoform X2 [Physella acuta]
MASYITRNGTFHDPDLLKRNLLALNDQRNYSHFCDVVLRVSGTQIYAHSNVLAAASPYFGSFLGVGADCPRMFSQKHPQIIEIHIESKDGDGGYGEAVSKVVEFMYTSQINLTTSLVCQIIEIGKIMQMDRLLQFCERYQFGEDDNIPQDKATCTTGLQEIANLLGSRAKTIKHADVSTETEESVFKKLEIKQTGSLHVRKSCSSSSQPLKSIKKHNINQIDTYAQQACSEYDTNQPQEKKLKASEEKESAMEILPEPICFDIENVDQNDASLLLAISNVRPVIKVDDPDDLGADSFSKKISCTTSLENSSSLNSSDTGTFIKNVQTDDCLNNVRTLADMMNITVEKSSQELENTTLPEIIPESNTNTIDLQTPLISVYPPQDQQKEFNLEEISDLVIFDPVTTALLQSKSNRVWSRGRGRGRGRGRKRRPGRPRKAKEQPESDPEFEEFINRLERGDTVVPQEIETNSVTDSNVNKSDSKSVLDETIDEGTMSKDSQEIQPIKNEPGKNILSNSRWRSCRVRFKPSLLKKDFIMHSLTKKSRAQQEKDSDALGTSEEDAKAHSSKGDSSNIKFVCVKCNYSSSLFKDYRQHMKSHPETDPRYFVCEKCDFNTTKSREFNAHKQKHMVEELICSYCEHRAESKEEFIEHAKKHEGDTPYFCEECDSRFKTKNQLFAHKPKHQLEKPFVCAICGSGFKWKHALKNHMITHSATKDHLCDVCGYATAHKSQLKAHKLIHTGHMFKCPVQGCRFEATKRQNLKYHMVTHTHERAHQCDICGQSFSLIKNMRRHMLLHTDVRPFSCKLCSFSTTRYDKLKEHNHKLHNIGAAPVPKREISEEPLFTLTADGGITEEALQTIAQLALPQNLNNIDLQGTTINIERTAEDGTVYPIIATVQSFTDSTGKEQ